MPAQVKVPLTSILQEISTARMVAIGFMVKLLNVSVLLLWINGAVVPDPPTTKLCSVIAGPVLMAKAIVLLPLAEAVIVEVPALKVKLMLVPRLITVPPPEKAIVTVLAPKLIALTLLLVESNRPIVTAYPAVVNVPFVIVSSLLDPMFNASASCTVPP